MSWSKGMNEALVKKTTTYPDGRVKEQCVAPVGYTESAKPVDFDPHALINYLQREFEYIRFCVFLDYLD